VADDHGFIRAGVDAVLRGTPFQVVATAASGEEALAAIEQHNPAVVLLDINMPGLNGVAALEALREKGDERPVVLLTAEITDRQLMAVMRAGVQGIVSKDGAESELSRCWNGSMPAKRQSPRPSCNARSICRSSPSSTLSPSSTRASATLPGLWPRA
jgi:DNA-binding NarL/FixJ family response regulator